MHKCFWTSISKLIPIGSHLSFEVHIAPNYNFGQYVKIRSDVDRLYVLHKKNLREDN
jgi:hypothetical protein